MSDQILSGEWIRCHSKKYNRPYWHNIYTKENTWILPSSESNNLLKGDEITPDTMKGLGDSALQLRK